MRKRYVDDDIEHTDERKQLADLPTKPTERVPFEITRREIGITLGEQ